MWYLSFATFLRVKINLWVVPVTEGVIIMYKSAVKERIETISKDQLSQLLVSEVCGLSATAYTEIIGTTQSTKEIEQFGFSIMTDEGYVDKVACFYEESNVDKLMNFINNRKISESSINFDNQSITINFAEKMEVYIEIM